VVAAVAAVAAGGAGIHTAAAAAAVSSVVLGGGDESIVDEFTPKLCSISFSAMVFASVSVSVRAGCFKLIFGGGWAWSLLLLLLVLVASEKCCDMKFVDAGDEKSSIPISL
jgi:hypothetical protein